ncbi:hypothetical protein K1719_026374 [Acacia pycnantha]|nr:hypothetical protein K1719_026374 [Acacia pycnantha]
MTIKLGSITNIVISSPDLAKEALQTHNIAFSGKTVPHTLQTHGHHKVSVVFLDPSLQWKTLRRACITKIFSSSQLDSTQNLRLSKLQEMLDTLFSIDLAGFASDSSRESRDLVWGMMEEAGRPNISDCFPCIRVLDPQCARSRMDKYSGKLLKILLEREWNRLELRKWSQTGYRAFILGFVGCWVRYNIKYRGMGYGGAITVEGNSSLAPTSSMVSTSQIKALEDAEICGFTVPKKCTNSYKRLGYGKRLKHMV